MPKINKNALEESVSPLADNVQTIMSASFPFWFCGVNRKINIGNFENIDVYGGIGLPVMMVPDLQDAESLEDFRKLIVGAAELGFSLASKETGDRYQIIKEMQKGGRK